MAKTLIIVEDDSDKYTFEAIIRHIHLQDNFNVIDTPDIDFQSISDENNPLKPNALIKGLKALLNDISNEKYDKIGIIRDMDTHNKENRLMLVNNALKEAYPDSAEELSDVNKLIPFEFEQNSTREILTVHFACHFVPMNNIGEIEDILKAIKNKPSPIADCIDAQLPDCLKISGDELREKDLVKLWFNLYQRYDNLPKKQRKSPFTTTKYIMENRTDLFDFNKDLVELNALKEFLHMMNIYSVSVKRK
jgi:hypothetical protein